MSTQTFENILKFNRLEDAAIYRRIEERQLLIREFGLAIDNYESYLKNPILLERLIEKLKTRILALNNEILALNMIKEDRKL